MGVSCDCYATTHWGPTRSSSRWKTIERSGQPTSTLPAVPAALLAGSAIFLVSNTIPVSADVHGRRKPGWQINGSSGVATLFFRALSGLDQTVGEPCTGNGLHSLPDSTPAKSLPQHGHEGPLKMRGVGSQGSGALRMYVRSLHVMSSYRL